MEFLNKTTTPKHIVIDWFSLGTPDLLHPRAQRQEDAERTIRQFATLTKLAPSSLVSTHPSIWGSDGSMTPAAAGIIDPKSVTAALTGPLTVVLKIEGRNISILQGELIGLILGLTLSPIDDPDAVLYTDHLNSVRLIEDSRTIVDQRHRLRTMNARSYYRWILALTSLSSPHHTHRLYCTNPHLLMDDYTFFTDTDGWIESNIRNFIDKLSTRSISQHLGAGHQQRMALHLYDLTPPPEWSYTHAYSAYSAVVQLYARSGQLPSADLLHSRGKIESPLCRMGCIAIEDAHHIFVECPRYSDWRSQSYRRTPPTYHG
ncbi:hypothetical protein B0H13DRAFT_2358283 [Mycena leptocephala]|nr:hypothetical protein B0H13DRAFT_2358283 [Mycena leptocephala]